MDSKHKINDLLKMADTYAHNILKTSLQMRSQEMAAKQRPQKRAADSAMNDPRGSKRKRVADDGESGPQSPTRGSSAAENINFAGQPKCLSS